MGSFLKTNKQKEYDHRQEALLLFLPHSLEALCGFVCSQPKGSMCSEEVKAIGTAHQYRHPKPVFTAVLKAGPQHGRDALPAAALQGKRSPLQRWGSHTGAVLFQNLPVLSLLCL